MQQNFNSNTRLWSPFCGLLALYNSEHENFDCGDNTILAGGSRNEALIEPIEAILDVFPPTSLFLQTCIKH